MRLQYLILHVRFAPKGCAERFQGFKVSKLLRMLLVGLILNTYRMGAPFLARFFAREVGISSLES